MSGEVDVGTYICVLHNQVMCILKLIGRHLLGYKGYNFIDM